MEKKNVDFLFKPIVMMNGEEFSSLLRYTLQDLSKNKELAHGLKELRKQLGCGASMANNLSRLGVFEEAVVSSIGKRKLYDVEKARELADKYQKEHKNNNIK